jgi:GMP synthase-like glutamine amidotransferase
MNCGKPRVIVLDRVGNMWESKDKLKDVMKRENWEMGGEVREGDIVIILGNSGRVLREGKDEEIDKIMDGRVYVIGICWGWEYLNKEGVVLEGLLKKGWKEGEWYNHNDMVKRMGDGWRGRKERGMWMEGRRGKWRGTQYHPEANEKSMKKMLKRIKEWRNEKRRSCGVVIKKLKSAREVGKTRKRAYREWRAETRKRARVKWVNQ